MSFMPVLLSLLLFSAVVTTDGATAYAPLSWSTAPQNPATVYGNATLRTTTVTAKTSGNVNVGVGGDLFVAELFSANATCDTNLYTHSCVVSCSPYNAPHTRSPSCSSSARIEAPAGPHWVDAVVTDNTDGTYTVVYAPEAAGTYDLSIRLATAGGLRGKYYDNIWFLDDPAVDRIDATINFQWGVGALTTYGVDYVSVRWEGKLRPRFSETFSIYAFADDGIRVWIDRRLVIDKWSSCCNESWANVDLVADHFHDILIDYKELQGSATAELRWSSPSVTKEIIPAVNLYHLDHIYNSPFSSIYIAAGDPPHPATTTAVGPGLLSPVAGEQNNFTIYARDIFNNDQITQSDAVFSVVLLNGSDTSFSSSVSFVSNGTYLATFSSNFSNTYNMSIRVDGVDISGSPTTISIAPAATSTNDTIAYGSGLSVGTTGVTGTFVVQARDRFGNNRTTSGDDLKVALSGTNAPVADWLYVDGGRYQVFYTPTKNGSLTIGVRLGDDHIAGSPFTASIVVGSVHAPSCIAEAVGASLTNAVAGVTSRVFVIARDEFGNQLSTSGITGFSLQLVGAGSVVSHHAYVDVGNGVYALDYNAPRTGTYTMNVKLGVQHIAASPFTVVVAPGAAVAATSNASGTALSSAVAGSQHSFTVEARDLHSNLLDASGSVVTTVVNCSNRFNTGSGVYEGNGAYRVSFMPEVSGACLLRVLLDGSDINGSPFALSVQPGAADATNSTVSGVALGGGVAGVTTSLLVQAVDQDSNNLTSGGDIITVDVSDHDGASVTTTLLDNADGSYLATLRPTKTGNELITVKLAHSGGLDVTFFSDLVFSNGFRTAIATRIDYDWGFAPAFVGFPADKFSVRWSGKINAPYTETFTFTTSIEAKSGVRVYVDGVLVIDEWDFSAGTAELFGSAALVHDVLSTLVVEFREDTGRSKLVLYWESASQPKVVVPSSALYYVKHVADSPYNTTIISAAVSRAKTTAAGVGLAHAVAGIRQSFVITARDEFDNIQDNAFDANEFTVTLAQVYGNATVSGTVTALGTTGQYNVSYIATVAGVYTVTIKHSAESDHIYGSPFRNLMVAVGATDASSTAATGAALTAAVAGVESTFYLQTYDAASNARTVGGDTWTITMTKGATTVSVQVVDANDGSYTASYNATVSGTYALVVKVNGVSLSSSPYTLVVSPATAAASTSTFPLGVSSPTAGVLSSFVIQAFDAFSNAHTVGNHDFFVQFVDRRGNIVRGNVTDNASGNYTVFYTVASAGNHTVSVLLASGVNGVADGLKGDYYNNRWLQDTPVITRVDKFIDFQWGDDLVTPSAKDYVSVRWSGYVRPQYAETYTFYVDVDDGARLYVDDVLVIDQWLMTAGEYSGTFAFPSAGFLYSITLEWRESTSDAKARLLWSSASVPKSIVPQANLFSDATHLNGSPFVVVAV